MHELRMLLLQRPGAVSALQESQNKKNDGVVAPLQLRVARRRDKSRPRNIVYLSFGAFPWIAAQIFHTLKAFSIEGVISHGCSDGKHDIK